MARPARLRRLGAVVALATAAVLVAGSAAPAAGLRPRGSGGSNRRQMPVSDTRTGPSPGGSVTGVELAALARRALDDPGALAQLRRVRRVDGRPADLGAALAGASGPDLRARLVALAGPGGAAGPRATSSGTARTSARAVLARRKYHPRRLPRPLAGVLSWLGARLEPVFGPIGRALSRLADSPEGIVAIVLGLVALFAAVAAWLALGRTRSSADVERRAAGSLVDPAADPEELERRAEIAEREGSFALAVRLRYEAGLVRLHRAGQLELRPDTTTGEAVRQVDRPGFTALTTTFEELVYGDRPAVPADLAAARAGWAELLAVGVAR